VKRAAAGAIVLILATAPAGLSETLRVNGVIDNGTTGRPPAAGTRVEVAVVGADGGRLDVATAEVDAKGRFETTVDGLAGSRIVLSTRHAGITYSTVARPGAAVARAELLVFETTRDVDALSVEADTTVFEDSGDEIEALQIVRMANSSHRTFVGEPGDSTSFRLPLPTGAFDVSIVDGLTPGRSEPHQSELRAGDPIQPGDATFSYAYKLPVVDGETDLQRGSFYSTERMDVLVEPGLELAGGGFRLLDDIDFGGDVYRQYVRNDVSSGEEVSFVLVESRGAGMWPVAAGVGTLLVLALAAWRLGRSRAARRSPLRQRGRSDLLEAIAALDVEHEAGAVADHEYEARREELKSRLP
jgi:hypothetical protein